MDEKKKIVYFEACHYTMNYIHTTKRKKIPSLFFLSPSIQYLSITDHGMNFKKKSILSTRDDDDDDKD
jgi:hypothetical protein